VALSIEFQPSFFLESIVCDDYTFEWRSSAESRCHAAVSGGHFLFEPIIGECGGEESGFQISAIRFANKYDRWFVCSVISHLVINCLFACVLIAVVSSIVIDAPDGLPAV